MGRGHHCGSCHVTFGTLGLFDTHRWGAVDARRCRIPGYPHSPLASLVRDPSGIWQTPEGLASNQRLAASLAAARDALSE
jgi:hypothetical protein